MSVLLLPTTPQPGLGGGYTRAAQLLFHYRSDFDLSLSALTKQARYVAAGGYRASNGWSVASNGKIVRVPHHLPRFDWYDLDGDGFCERPALVVESADTNLCGNADTLSAWTATGSGSVVAGPTLGELQMWLVTDSGGSQYQLSQATQATTGATVHGWSICAGMGPSPAPAGWYASLRDTTNSAFRGVAGAGWNADGTPNAPQCTTGTYIGARYLGTSQGIKWWRFFFASTALTSGAAHAIRCGAASTAAETGNVYLGGAMLTDALRVSSWIKTPTSASVTRTSEAVGWLSPFIPMAAMSQLVDIVVVAPGASGVPVNAVALITDKDGASPYFALTDDPTGFYGFSHHNGSTVVASYSLSAPAVGDLVRLHAIVYEDGSVQLGQGINGAAMVYGTRSLANAFSATLAFGADAATAGWYLLPSVGFTRSTRMLEWRASAGVLAEPDLAERW